MATLTLRPNNIIFDGRGYVLANIIILHRPKYTIADIPEIAVYGTDSNGNKITLLSSVDLTVAGSGNDGDSINDTYELNHDPVTSVRVVISNSENIIAIDDLAVTVDLPVEVVENV